MNSEFLEVYKENCQEALEESLPVVESGELSYDDLINVCGYYRIKAITHLLLDYDFTKFKIDLYKSSRTFLAGLKFIDKKTIVVSKAAPLFDAIVSGDYDGAVDICKFMDRPWNKDVEYHEDYLFTLFIISQFELVEKVFEFNDFFSEYTEALGDDSDPQLNVLKAIFNGDQADFDEAMIEYLEDYKNKMGLLTENESASPEFLATEGNICIIGIILLKIAEKKNFRLDSEYLFIPQVSRQTILLDNENHIWSDPVT